MYTSFNPCFNKFTHVFYIFSFRFIVAVTVERLIAIKFPLQAHIYLQKRRIYIAIFAIFLSSYLVTFYQNLAFVREYLYCQDTQVYIVNLFITDNRIMHKYSSSLIAYYKGKFCKLFYPKRLSQPS